MPFSRFTTTRLDEGTVRVSGPFGFAPQEPEMQVTSLHFLLFQEGHLIHGEGGADGGTWDGTAAARSLEPGPAKAVGVAVLADPGPPPAYETYTWYDEVEVT